MNSARQPKTLWALSKGETCAVSGYDDALPEPYRVRLMEFGFHQGEAVTCLLTPGFGAPRVYRVSNTVFSLDSEIAQYVLVALAEDPNL
ncbi:MAG: FeoA family protein [Halieaceae bacterium]|jgi:Fe2+ transport system protein FeoA